MTLTLPVKEHLRNGALYRPPAESSISGEWRHRLLFRHTMQGQLKAVLRERRLLPRQFVYIGVPALCLAFVFAAYFGFIHPERWFETVVRIADFEVPPVGLKEVVIFIAVVNGLTLLIKKRVLSTL